MAANNVMAAFGGGTAPTPSDGTAWTRLASLDGHRGSEPVKVVVVSSDCRMVITGAKDGTMRAWIRDEDPPAGTSAASAEAHKLYKPDGKPMNVHAKAVTALALSRDGRLMYSAAEDKKLCFWTYEFGPGSGTASGRAKWDTQGAALEVTGKPGGGRKTDRALALSADGAWLFSGGESKTVVLWRRGKSVTELAREFPKGVTALALHSDDDKAGEPRTLFVADGGDRGTIWRFAPRDGDAWHDGGGGEYSWDWALCDGGRMDAHAGQVTALALSRDGGTLYSGGVDRAVVVWREFGPGGHWQPACRLCAHNDAPTCLAVSPKGESLYVACFESVAWYSRKLAEPGTQATAMEFAGRLVPKPMSPDKSTSRVHGVALSPDGATLLIAGDLLSVFWRPGGWPGRLPLAWDGSADGGGSGRGAAWDSAESMTPTARQALPRAGSGVASPSPTPVSPLAPLAPIGTPRMITPDQGIAHAPGFLTAEDIYRLPGGEGSGGEGSIRFGQFDTPPLPRNASFGASSDGGSSVGRRTPPPQGQAPSLLTPLMESALGSLVIAGAAAGAAAGATAAVAAVAEALAVGAGVNEDGENRNGAGGNEATARDASTATGAETGAVGGGGNGGEVVSTTDDGLLTPAQWAELEKFIFREPLPLDVRIGAGSFSTVYTAMRAGGKVAVKKLHPPPGRMRIVNDDGSFMSDAEWAAHVKREEVEAFVTEVRLLMSLRHDCIVPLFGCWLEPDLCIVMEYMDKLSLMYNLETLHPSLYKHIAREIARGMVYMHSQNVIHMDLKTGNVLLNKRNNVKIADFGLAKVQSADFSHVSGRGTLTYQAPETLKNQRCTKASDVYSYGLLLWELVECERPYLEMKGELEIMAHKLQGIPLRDPERPARLNMDVAVRDLLVRVFRACTAHDPSLRPTFAQVLELLGPGQPEPAAIPAAIAPFTTAPAALAVPANGPGPGDGLADPQALGGAGPLDGIALPV